ncbi:hypothetical protein FFLO_02177 [Filobasidium floriforme]|uniref:Cytoplasmic protein n=1 Tax=Filobasidium floriforme TaxID=5210 RepID=A0A8K0NU93_9TREE|nr:uncharacterized protein HD553DRAFT_306420 [Filobasidium floriforme]KAG7562397.1 hypothetical protein FFLO_02177 [Filobasidium floriforme]KAH8088430.1 hypothetical protein HD553DRAFT_306420 [Filobasidium floriforme]
MPPRNLPTDPAKLTPSILRYLESSPPDGYSAHQKARTTAARLVHSGHKQEAIQVLFISAKELLKVQEWGSGTDLGCYMVETYRSAEVQVDSESKARVTQLLALMTSEGTWRKKLADLTIKWSLEFGDCQTGDPDLHKYIGELYYKDRKFVQAEQHLVASCKRDAAVTLAEMAYEWCGKGAEDPAPYACRVVIPFISITPPAILPARTFLSKFITLLSSSDSSFIATTLTYGSGELPLTTSSTLNWLQMAVLTVQRAPAEGVSGVQARGTTGGISREWESLVRKYKGQDKVVGSQAVQEALLHISTNTFKIPPPRQAGGGPDLMNLMGSLFGGAPARR